MPPAICHRRHQLPPTATSCCHPPPPAAAIHRHQLLPPAATHQLPPTTANTLSSSTPLAICPTIHPPHFPPYRHVSPGYYGEEGHREGSDSRGQGPCSLRRKRQVHSTPLHTARGHVACPPHHLPPLVTRGNPAHTTHDDATWQASSWHRCRTRCARR